MFRYGAGPMVWIRAEFDFWYKDVRVGKGELWLLPGRFVELYKGCGLLSVVK